jgi:photosystem II stability/assembly factor-like uncharacterized protein
MKIRRASCILSVVALLSIAPSAQAQTTVRHVAGRTPVLGASREMAADRPEQAKRPDRFDSLSPTANPWKLQATLPGAVIHDISFPTPKIGFAAAELGQIWKTNNGGSTWTEIMNLGFPYYWYGIHAQDANDVVVSGFNDSNFEGIIRWSHDGGNTWSSDIVLTTTGWCFRVRFASAKYGLILDGLNLDAANAAHYTTDGGTAAPDWTEDVPDPNGGWFGNEFSLLTNLHARASGINFCTSLDAGVTWNCGPAVDSVFDGPAFFSNDTYGWVGGGEISPNLEGWVHRTTDGGTTWSGRTLDISWPVRELLFITPNIGWAAGGNYSTNVGGMYFSRDGGQTWSLDVSTGAEMGACDTRRSNGRNQIWCAGYNGSFNGVVYTLSLK